MCPPLPDEVRVSTVPPGAKGWLLVSLIVLVSIAIIALIGISFFLTEHFRVTSLRQNQTKAIYLAQAGVMQAIYDFRSNAGISLGEQTVAAGPAAGTSDDDVFILGGQMADFFLVNLKPARFVSGTVCGISGRRLQDWPLRNVVAAPPTSLTATTMSAAWGNDLGERIMRIDLNTAANTVWWAPGCQTCTAACQGVPAGTLLNITDQTIGAWPARWNQNRIWFSGGAAMASKPWVEITFNLSDGTSRTARYEPAFAGRSADFTIKSVGEVRRGAFPFAPFPLTPWRRLQAEHRICAEVTAVGQCGTATDERERMGYLVSQRELPTKAD